MQKTSPITREGQSRRDFLRWAGASLAVVALPLSLSTATARADGDFLPEGETAPEILHRWQLATRTIVTEESVQKVFAKLPVRSVASRRDLQRLLHAAREGSPVTVHYLGGTNPGVPRPVLPRFVYQVEGFSSLYLDCYCLQRQAPRTFALNRLAMVETKAHPAVVS